MIWPNLNRHNFFHILQNYHKTQTIKSISKRYAQYLKLHKLYTLLQKYCNIFLIRTKFLTPLIFMAKKSTMAKLIYTFKQNN